MLAVVLLSAGAACGAATPAGIPPEATPLEEVLAESPSPSDYYRSVLQMWDGVPGLGALRERWEGFASARPGYLVLVALLSEAEGNPEAAVERLRALPGEHAAWQTARILAALGDESGAVPLLEGLVSQKAFPDLAAQALLALTERDCIRGDFAGALVRSRAAWAAQTGESFRIQVLERHVSLLVEAGAEKAFVEEQTAEMKSPDAERSRTARHVLAAVGDWFTGDKALRELSAEVRKKEGLPMVNSGNALTGSGGLQTVHRGFHPVGAELLKVASDPAAPVSLATAAAYEMAKGGRLPDSLEAWPLLSRSRAQRPLTVTMSLFAHGPQGVRVPAPLLEDIEKRLAPDVSRRVFGLYAKAWSGKATAADAGELVRIIGEAPSARRYVPGWSTGGTSSASQGWPYPPRLPDDVLIWNLSGARWASYYRQSCRLQIVLQQSLPAFPDSHPSAGLIGWRHWRPDLPPDGVEPVMHWAWEQLRAMQADTPARFEEAALLLTDPGDRAVFAAVTHNRDQMARWCADAAFVKQMRSPAIMHVLNALAYNAPRIDAKAPSPPHTAAALLLVQELAGRLGLKAADLARASGISGIIHPQDLAPFSKEPMDENIVAVLGEWSWDHDVRARAQKRRGDAIPHPLYGLPAEVPSVARFMMLAYMLQAGPAPEACHPSSDSPGVYALRQLLGWAAAGQPEFPLTGELQKFETNHPIKKRAQRWQELLKENAGAQPEPPPADGTPAPRSYERDLRPPQRAALAHLAAEEKNSHEWQLVYLALGEKDSEKRKALLEAFRARSPLTAGAWLETKNDAGLPVTATPPPAVRTAAETADILVEAWASPEGRQALEPAGAISCLLTDYRTNAFNIALAPFIADAARLQELVAALLAKRDPLAARAAAWLASCREAALRKPVLAKAAAAFPDDPEILIAHAMADPEAPGAKTALLRGLGALKTIYISREGRSLRWCGVSYGFQWHDAEVAEAIAAYGAKAEPGQLPMEWSSVLYAVLRNAESVRQVKDVSAVVKALLRHAKPMPSNNGQEEPWPGLINALQNAGQAGTAAELAAGVLSMPRGDLFYPQQSDPVWPWYDWESTVISSRKTEGWRILQSAAGKDPARLAEQLRKAHAAHPQDQNIALGALLARGLAGALTAESLSFLADMEATGRHRAVAVASWLLPESVLPPALCLDAWQADAARSFTVERHNGTRSFKQGMAYLQKLERAGAGERVAATLGILLECLAEMTSWPEEEADEVAEYVRRSGAAKDRAALGKAFAAHIDRTQPSHGLEAALAKVLYLCASAPDTLPESVAKRVDALLATAVAPERPPELLDGLLRFVCEAAALYPRWREPVRAVLVQRVKEASSPEALAVWRELAVMMKALESGLLVPEVKVILEPGAPNEGSLRWDFSSLVFSPAPPPPRKELSRWEEHEQRQQQKLQVNKNKWQELANTLTEKFDAVVLVENLSGTGRRVIGRVEKMASSGELKLTGLPDAGRLVIHLYGREAPYPAGETGPLVFNAAPVLIDTALPAKPAKHPPGWQLLGEPAPLGSARSWDVRTRSGSLPNSLHFLLLDEDGQVCAAGSQWLHFPKPGDPPAEEGAFIVRQSEMSAGPSNLPVAGFSITPAGPPKRIALALPEVVDPGEAPPGRITMQELKVDNPPPPGALRPEVERIWFTNPAGGYSPLTLRPDGTYAAWLNGRQLSLVDLRKDAGPVITELPVPENAILSGAMWVGPLLRLALRDRENKKEPETLIVEINAADAAPQPKLTRLPGQLNFAPGPLPSTFTVLVDRTFRGVITAEGKLLETPADQKYQYERHASPTSILCQPVQPGPRAQQDGLHHIFDWSTGKLELTLTKDLPPADAFRNPVKPSWSVGENGLLMEVNAKQQRTCVLPFRLTNPVLLDDTRLVATSEYGVVRLRVPPSTPR